jgi:hypothetical protein
MVSALCRDRQRVSLVKSSSSIPMKAQSRKSSSITVPWTALLSAYSLLITGLWFYGSINAPSAVSLPQVSHKVTGLSKPPAPIVTLNKPVSTEPVTPAAGSSASAATPSKIDWAPLESEDFAVYAWNLRAAGLPERVVKQIMAAEVRGSFDHDRMALVEKENTPFWDASYDTEEEMAEELAQVAEQEAAFLASLIGPLDTATVDEIKSRRPKPAFRFGIGMEAGKKQAVTAVFDRTREAIQRAPTENLADELTRIDAQREAELADLLTPQEREDFEIRNSPLGAEIRHAIREQGGQVSEEQFRELFRLRQDLTLQMEAAADTGQDLTFAFERFEALVSQAVVGQGL